MRAQGKPFAAAGCMPYLPPSDAERVAIRTLSLAKSHSDTDPSLIPTRLLFSPVKP